MSEQPSALEKLTALLNEQLGPDTYHELLERAAAESAAKDAELARLRSLLATWCEGNEPPESATRDEVESIRVTLLGLATDIETRLTALERAAKPNESDTAKAGGEAPKFKVGDWVQYKGQPHTKGQIENVPNDDPNRDEPDSYRVRYAAPRKYHVTHWFARDDSHIIPCEPWPVGSVGYWYHEETGQILQVTVVYSLLNKRNLHHRPDEINDLLGVNGVDFRHIHPTRVACLDALAATVESLRNSLTKP